MQRDRPTFHSQHHLLGYNWSIRGFLVVAFVLICVGTGVCVDRSAEGEHGDQAGETAWIRGYSEVVSELDGKRGSGRSTCDEEGGRFRQRWLVVRRPLNGLESGFDNAVAWGAWC